MLWDEYSTTVKPEICAFAAYKMTLKKQTALNGNVNGNANALERHLNGNTVASISKPEATDIQRWRLLDEAGQQTWHYLETDEEIKAWPQSTADRYFLGLPLVNLIPAPCALQCH